MYMLMYSVIATGNICFTFKHCLVVAIHFFSIQMFMYYIFMSFYI